MRSGRRIISVVRGLEEDETMRSRPFRSRMYKSCMNQRLLSASPVDSCGTTRAHADASRASMPVPEVTPRMWQANLRTLCSPDQSHEQGQEIWSAPSLQWR